VLVWIVDTYVIFFACLVIPGGSAGDRFGRKGVLLAGLGLFALGALMSAAAPNVAVMLSGRAITGRRRRVAQHPRRPAARRAR
jgi:MFS family permease